MASSAQVLAIALAIFGAAATIDAACTKASPYVGFSGPLTTVDHMVSAAMGVLRFPCSETESIAVCPRPFTSPK